MESQLESPYKKLNKNFTYDRKSKRMSSQSIVSKDQQNESNQQKSQQVVKIQGQIQSIQSKMDQLEKKMIIEMKRIGDNQESQIYKRMVKQNRQLKKQITQLKVKEQVINKKHQINPQKVNRQTNQDIISYKSKQKQLPANLRNNSSKKAQRTQSFDQVSQKSHRKSLSNYPYMDSKKSKQFIKQQDIQLKNSRIKKSKISRKDTIQSLKAELIKSQVLIDEGIKLLKKNSDTIMDYEPYKYFRDPFFNPLFYSGVYTSKWT